MISECQESMTGSPQGWFEKLQNLDKQKAANLP
jgi:hypothetical protein